MEHVDNQGSQLPDSLTIELRRPVTVGANTITSVTLREPLAGELEVASRAQTGVGGLMELIAAVANVPRAVPEKMGSRELARADAFFNSFSVQPAEVGEGDDFIDEVTITLRKPVSIGKAGSEIVFDKLELAEPNGGQKDKAGRESNDTRAAIALISTVAKVPRLAVERLCRRDFEEACNFLASCNVVGQTTGAT